MKKLLKEFRDFALKGNMFDLAVGVIIGGAFNGLVSSLVSNIIMPVLTPVSYTHLDVYKRQGHPVRPWFLLFLQKPLQRPV